MPFLSHAVRFEIVCPNTHEQTVSFTAKSLEAALKADEPLFHCNTCDTNWNPSSDQIAEMRKKLEVEG